MAERVRSSDGDTLRRLVSMAASIRTQCEELKRVHDDGTFGAGLCNVALVSCVHFSVATLRLLRPCDSCVYDSQSIIPLMVIVELLRHGRCLQEGPLVLPA
jgi:hypothetical protein